MREDNDNEKQIRYNDEAVPIEYIAEHRKKYLNVPPWQRKPGVWPEYRKQRLINMILRRGFVPALILFPDVDNPEKFYILDGQQRLTTILAFIDNRFKTGQTHRGRAGQRYLEPNRFFRDLPEEKKNRILGFRLRYSVLQETDPTRLRELYVELQNLSPLKTAEILYASDTVAHQAVLAIEKHPYFSEIYSGGNERHETYQMASYPLAIELCGPLFHIESGKVGQIVQEGAYDQWINDALIARVEEVLLYTLHLFKNVRTKSLSAIIVHYQAVILLQLCNYNLDICKEGCLTDWFNGLDPSNVSRGASVFSQIGRFGFQNIFWSQHLPEVALLVGGGDFAEITRICAWMHNRHFCPACNTSVKLEDIKQHGFKLDGALDCRSQPILTAQSNGHANIAEGTVLTPVNAVASEKL